MNMMVQAMAHNQAFAATPEEDPCLGANAAIAHS